MLHLTLASPDRDFIDVARHDFRQHEGVSLHLGKFEEVSHFDCVVTAGNSFGLMDAGIDLAVVRFFGTQIQEVVQKRILEDYLGEQPVGTSILVETGSSPHPWLAHSPTMRIPANISSTDHVYLATWATLLAIHRHNRMTPKQLIECVVFPAFGIGTGGMDVRECSLQMLAAYEHFLNPPEFLNGSLAQSRQERIHYGGNWGFQHPRERFDV